MCSSDLAYLVTRDNKTVLRSGVGLFYDKIPLNVAYFEQLQQRQVTRFAADGTEPAPPATPDEFKAMMLREYGQVEKQVKGLSLKDL